MNDPSIWIMVGISGSGKSTIAKQIAEVYNCEIVSSDAIRGEICNEGVIDQTKNDEVFKLFHQRIKNYLRSGKNVVADATHINMKSRRSLLENIKKIDCHKIAYIVPKSVEKCIEDNINKEYPVPHHVIQKQMMNFQVPYIEEGFNDIELHKFEREYDISLDDVFNEMKDYNQENPHHTMLLDKHCAHTARLFNDAYNHNHEFTLAAYIHDIGKIFTRKFDDDGVAHYYQHENVGAYYMLSSFNNMHVSEKQMLNMCFLINYHMMPMGWSIEKINQRWRRRFGEYKYKLLLDFNQCDKSR